MLLIAGSIILLHSILPHWHDEHDLIGCNNVLKNPDPQKIDLFTYLIHQDPGENHLENILPQYHNLIKANYTNGCVLITPDLSLYTSWTLILPEYEQNFSSFIPPEHIHVKEYDIHLSSAKRGPPFGNLIYS